MRSFIRHPSSVPIEYVKLRQQDCLGLSVEVKRVRDLCEGGLCFCTQEPIELGILLRLRINVVSPPFEVLASVVWCEQRANSYEAGVKFISTEDAFAARMVEQICHIEHYRLWVKEVQGRELGAEAAANEWIAQFAEDFPSIA